MIHQIDSKNKWFLLSASFSAKFNRHVFMWQSVEFLSVFNTLTLKQIFWKTKFFTLKLQYRFLVESNKIENASLPYKTAMSEADVKTNRIVSTNWTNHKERSNYFVFFENLVSVYKELFWCTDDPNVHIHTFTKRWNFIWGGFFPVRILKVQHVSNFTIIEEENVLCLQECTIVTR